MITVKKTSIYLPENINTVCQKYNNGYIMWMSGEKSTVVQYLDISPKTKKKNVPLDFKINKNQILLRKSNLTNTQSFYNVYQNKYHKVINKYYNLVHMQLNKAILRATIGIKKYLLVRGVGYKLIKKNKYLMIHVGFSHKINILIPSYIKTKSNRKSTKLKFKGDDSTFVTGLLASIRRFKKPDVYKGKGIRYRKDNVIRKEGKKKKNF